MSKDVTVELVIREDNLELLSSDDQDVVLNDSDYKALYKRPDGKYRLCVPRAIDVEKVDWDEA